MSTEIAENTLDNPEVENLYVLSGGGAAYGWSSEVLWRLSNAGFKPSMIGSTSTGTIAAFMYSKDLYEQNVSLCDEVYSTNAKAITKPGIASIQDGKLKINWFKALTQLTFNKNKIVSLMDNSPLFDTLTKLDNLKPGFPIPVFYNRVNMKTGKLDECSTLQPMDQSERIKSLVASTSIPVVWAPVDGIFSDAGLRDGSPLSAMFGRTEPGKKYRIIVINCNSQEMAEFDDLKRIDKIAGRTVSIVLNETLINDLGRTEDRNEVAKAIDEHRHELPQAFLDKLPYNYAPIYIIEYKGPSSTFSFTPESLAEQRLTAKADVEAILSTIK